MKMQKECLTIKVKNQKVIFDTSEKIPDYDVDGELVITSPPYWDLKDYSSEKQIGYNESYQKYLDRLTKVFHCCYKNTTKNAIMVVNVNSIRREKKYYPIAMDIVQELENWELIQNLIWYKPNSLPQPNYYLDKLFDDKYENLLVFAKNKKYNHTFNKIRVNQKYKQKEPRESKMNDKGRSIGNVINMRAYRPPTIKDENYHAAAFPEELIYGLIHTFSNEGDTVIDPFLGSGTTLKVCRNMNRRGIGFEINKGYKKLIKNRILEDMDKPSWQELDIISDGDGEVETNNIVEKGVFDY